MLKIEDQRIWPGINQAALDLLRSAGRCNVEASGFKGQRKHLTYAVVVVDDQHAAAGCGSIRVGVLRDVHTLGISCVSGLAGGDGGQRTLLLLIEIPQIQTRVERLRRGDPEKCLCLTSKVDQI